MTTNVSKITAEIAAHHEAAHAVASVYCGWHFRHVTTRKQKRYAGRICYDCTPIDHVRNQIERFGLDNYNYHAALIAKPPPGRRTRLYGTVISEPHLMRQLAKDFAKIVEQDLIILFAGGLAERKLTRQTPKLDCNDQGKAWNLVIEARGQSAAAQAYYYRLRRKAKDFVDSHWREIKRVAEALRKRKTLTNEEVTARCQEGGGMNTLFLLMAQYNAAVIPVESVVNDYFRHLTVESFLRKCLAGEIDLPVVRIESSQKSAKGVHINDLAAYLDKQTAAARKEYEQLRRAG